MNIYPTRKILLLITFGFLFFASCSTFFQTLTLDQTEQEFQNENYDSALNSINRILQEQPQNQDALWLKSRTLNELAREQERPERRFNYFREMRMTLEELDPDFKTQQRDSLIIAAWNREQNAGLRLLQQDQSERFHQHFYPIIAHFENALAINPDSSTTYNLKATTYYTNGDVPNAVETLEEAKNHINPLPTALREKLAFLYLEAGKIEESIAEYLSLYNEFPEDDEILHGLVNAYILGDHHEESVHILRDLTQENQDQTDYHETLATELYFLIESRADELLSNQPGETEFNEQVETLFDNLEEAEQHFIEVRENHPETAEIIYITAAFYKNVSGKLFDLSALAESPLSTTLEDKALELLESAVPLWESVVEQNPENPEMWKSMYQVYSKLGMDEEAESAREQTNL